MKSFQDRIACDLGLTPSGLAALAKFRAGRDPGGVQVDKLLRDGLVENNPSPAPGRPFRQMTPEGERVLDEARRRGW